MGLLAPIQQEPSQSTLGYQRSAQRIYWVKHHMRVVDLPVFAKVCTIALPTGLEKFGPPVSQTVSDAEPYARNPKALADKVYSNRMGNGENEGSVFIGRGFLQLTGKDNYRSFAADMRLPEVMTDPSLIETDYAFETAYWFFEKNRLFKIADGGRRY